ncbi:hypothetical protein FQN57_000586 [Myotisia sp. PD_48]|nr:hypothetical protein FQN57_000586 [Myotisia sp. PD_48]
MKNTAIFPLGTTNEDELETPGTVTVEFIGRPIAIMIRKDCMTQAEIQHQLIRENAILRCPKLIGEAILREVRLPTEEAVAIAEGRDQWERRQHQDLREPVTKQVSKKENLLENF